MKRTKLLVAAAALCSMLAVSAEAATVRWLHIEQNPDVAAFYDDVAKRFEAAHPGRQGRDPVPRERGVQEEADHAAAVARSAEHHLQLGRRRAARAGQGRRDRGPHRADGRGLARAFQPGGAAGLHLGRQGLRRADADLAGRLLLQQGPVRQGRRRRRHDQDLGRPARRGEEAARRPASRRSSSAAPTSGRCTSTGRTWPSASAASAAFDAALRGEGKGFAERHLRQGRRAVQAAGRPEAVPAGLPRRDLSAVVRPVRRRQGRDGADAQRHARTA